MRLFTCIIALALSVMTVNAKPISREQAKVRAASFMKLKGDVRKLSDVINQKRLAPGKASAVANKDMAPYYVFDRGTNEGFIIVSGDDQTIDVLGYCDNGSFDYSHLPINLQEWLDEYASQIVRIQRGAPVLKAASHPKVDQLMSSKWSQGSPYNLTCPLDGGSRSVTGCVATAMAQILYYNREKMVTETQADMPSYSTWTKGINVSGIKAGAAIDWENMKDTYGSATELQKTAVANLMLYCGVGAKMDYTSSSSGAQSSDAHTAFQKYFGCSQARFVTYNEVSTDEEWDRVVYQEMAAGRPTYVSGHNASAGHAFVADGYDGTRYHINWGWGGQSDGYYYLTNLTPGDGQGIGGSANGYNSWKEIIVNIEPDNYMEKKMTLSDATVRQICLQKFDANGDGSLTYGEVAAVTSLNDVFKGQTAIKNFKELYYFTGLTSLPDDAFNGCTQLESIRLPKALKSIGSRAFKDCEKLRQIPLPTGVNAIGAEAFSGCKAMNDFEFPTEVCSIEDKTFKDCSALTTIDLPIAIEKIGSEAFAGCTKLTSFTLNTFHPEDIDMGTSIFSGASIATAKLYVMQGTKTYFASAEQWKDFGTIIEVRELSGGKFATIETGKTYYLYNVGTGRYLTSGEAWGTQAIVGTDAIRFKLNHSASMPEGVYYLSTTDVTDGTSYVFRTTTDSNVGTGVQAAFVDGGNLTTNAYWKIEMVKDKVYTFQIPSNGTNYAEGKFWGVQTDHKSSAASPTYGVYSDVDYATHQKNCQWQFVLYDEAFAAKYEAAEMLAKLLSMAKKKMVKHTEEQAVYDNLDSSTEELLAAQSSLRKKMNLIEFADAYVRSTCISLFDGNADGELSYAEAEETSDLGWLFYSYFMNKTTVKSFDELQYFKNVPIVYSSTFSGCTNLESIVLPEGLSELRQYAFTNCKKLKAINLSKYMTEIEEECFSGCTSLREVWTATTNPSSISLGTDVFKGVPLASCTLYVPFGSKELYAAAPVWKNFGQIVEVRTDTPVQYSAIETNKTCYIYNIGTRKMLSLGEAYGTQSVVSRTGRLYQLKHTANMGEGVYYIMDKETEKVVFRTSTDSKVGEGVKACFGDGSLSTRAYWKLTAADDNTFTLQVPATDETYVESDFLGISEYHQSDIARPTYGLYWDVKGGTSHTKWAIISEDDMKAAQAMDELAARLAKMLNMAKEQQIDATTEQAVYDNINSTAEDIRAAIRSIREKMHLITFNDENAESISISNWDENGDGELSFEEAAAVTDIGEIFRGATSMKNFEELKYFTGLTSIPDNAFRSSSSLNAICLPASVKSIGMSAFTGCSVLRYLVLLNDNDLIAFGSCGLPKLATTIFVKSNMIASYEADERWKSSAKAITEYTGKPVVTATGTRIYGRSNAAIEMKVLGAPVFGTAETSCDVTNIATTPVGTYPISVLPGTITTTGVEYREGEFIITQAPLTITAKSYTRNVGEPNPEFELTYKSFRNRETDTVFTVRPVITCEATPESPAGEYEIVVSGAEAHNYAITYVNGTLTVVNPAGIKDLTTDGKDNEPIFDLQGRKVLQPKRGVYVTNKRKVIVK
jgi:hypothetical protein